MNPVETFPMDTFYPSSWFKGITDSSLWLSVYSVPTLQLGDLGGASIVRDFSANKVRAVLTHRSFRFLDISAATPTFNSPKSFRLDSPLINVKAVPTGVYLVLSAPVKIDGVERQESEIKEEINRCLSIILSIIGQSAAFAHVFDHVYRLDGSGVSVTSQPHSNYCTIGKPNLEKGYLDGILWIEKALFSTPPKEKNRIDLSLRWFHRATYDSGIDAFIKYWIALETISMPNTTKIKPLMAILAKAYSKEVGEVEHSFGIGKIFNLRSRIVHHGELYKIDLQFLLYMSCLYSDVLFSVLHLPMLRKAESCLLDPNIGDLKTLLKKIGYTRNLKRKST